MAELKKLKGVGPKRREVLLASGLGTPEELIYYIPRKFEDRTRTYKISDLEIDEASQILVQVEATILQGRGPKARLAVTVSDESGTLELLYFNGVSFWRNRFREGQRLLVWGIPKYFGGVQMVHPEVKWLKKGEEPSGSIFPIYTITEAMSGSRVDSKFLQGIILECLADYSISEDLPPDTIKALDIVSEKQGLEFLHNPKSFEEIHRGLDSLKKRELWPMCLEIEKERLARSQRGISKKVKGTLAKTLLENLPFKLTDGQQSVWKNISQDLDSKGQLMGMLQGEVGSGKSVLAALTCAQAVEAGFQAAVLLPTEVLATQQFESFQKFFAGSDVPISLLMGSTSPADRKVLLANLKTGTPQILIGTHALFSEDVHYGKLGLVVVDEQHRFGVRQREELEGRGTYPDILYMTATPIPRTLTQTLYGEFTHYLLGEKPHKGGEIKTRLVPRVKREGMKKYLADEAKKGGQIFWVTPRIEESKTEENEEEFPSPLTSIDQLEKELSSGPEKLNWVTLHGKMASEDKNRVLREFKEARYQVLLATTVIEVGVDVPNANFIVIENPDRFGLAQLHQLRGRVGRGGGDAWCMLMEPEAGFNPESRLRLKELEKMDEGQAIAELDLSLRGTGNLEGSQQSGFGHLRFSDLLQDRDLVLKIRKLAAEFLAQ